MTGFCNVVSTRGLIQKKQTIRESATPFQAGLAVDAEQGIIRNVKILGTESLNGRHYAESVLKESVPLYASAKCNIDHPANQSSPRSSRDRLGLFENARYSTTPSAGIYGDLRLLKSEPVSAKLIEAALDPAKHAMFGFSPVHECDVEPNGPAMEVKKILSVISVDLVADPATTNGLFEGRVIAEKPKFTFKKFIDGLQHKRAKTSFKNFLESVSVKEEDELPVDAPTSLEDQVKSIFQELMAKITNMDGDMKDKIAKIKKLLQVQEELMSAFGEEPAKPVESDSEQQKDDGDDAKKEEAIKLKAENSRLKMEAIARDAIYQSGLPMSETLLKSMTALGTKEAMETHVKFLKEQIGMGRQFQRQETSCHGAGSMEGSQTTSEGYKPKTPDQLRELMKEAA